MASVSTIYLLDPSADQPVEAELRDAIEQQQLDDWEQIWCPALNATLVELLKQGAGPSQWPQSWHWDWKKKIARVQGLLAFAGFSVVAQGVTQGLMQVDLTKAAREPSQNGKPLVYVEYLEAAPWNRPELGSVPRLRGVGSALLSAAMHFSVEEGFKGRIGLHSLPQADEFYRRIGMIDFGPDANCQDLRYFEMTAEQAHAVLDEE